MRLLANSTKPDVSLPLVHFDVDFDSVLYALCYPAVVFKDYWASHEPYFVFVINFGVIWMPLLVCIVGNYYLSSFFERFRR